MCGEWMEENQFSDFFPILYTQHNIHSKTVYMRQYMYHVLRVVYVYLSIIGCIVFILFVEHLKFLKCHLPLAIFEFLSLYFKIFLNGYHFVPFQLILKA